MNTNTITQPQEMTKESLEAAMGKLRNIKPPEIDHFKAGVEYWQHLRTRKQLPQPPQGMMGGYMGVNIFVDESPTARRDGGAKQEWQGAGTLQAGERAMNTSLLEAVTEAMHQALPSPRRDKWVPLSGFSNDYQRGIRTQAAAAIAAIDKWNRENAND